jgi:geranylgeranyl reductase family protein
MTGTDIAVVGAGPAGCYAAWQLARSGASVTLFDPSHPREKPCGGGLTARAVALAQAALGQAGLDGVPVRTLKFQSGPVDRFRSVSFAIDDDRGTPPLVVVCRESFDAALLRAAMSAGARLVAERVVDVAVGAHGATVCTRNGEHGARFLLGADGATSLVRRRLTGAFTRGQLSLATGCFARGVRSTEVVVHSVADPPGYLWSFPRLDHLAIGICAEAARCGPETLRRTASRWVRESGVAEGAALVPYSWPIPSLAFGDFERQAPSGERWMLLGDAAGLVDPLTREGIFYAMRSGQLAADALGHAIDPGASYAERLGDEVFPELDRAAALKAGFFTSHFADLLVDALERSAPVRAIMVDLIAGRQPYRSLRRRLLATFEAGLAFRLLRLQVTGMVYGRAS